MRPGTAFIPLVIAAGIPVSAGLAFAGENCTCRGNGKDIPEGQTVCLKTATGMKLARCERVLNNPSWTFLDSDCPTAQLPPQSRWSVMAS